MAAHEYRTYPPHLSGIKYDYTNQAWLIDGHYEPCSHPESMNCGCFGKLHAGEPAQPGASIH